MPRLFKQTQRLNVTLAGEAYTTSWIFPDWQMGWVKNDEAYGSADLIFALFESASRGQFFPTGKSQRSGY